MGGFGGTVLANPEATDGAPMSDVVYALQHVPGLSNGYVVVARCAANSVQSGWYDDVVRLYSSSLMAKQTQNVASKIGSKAAASLTSHSPRGRTKDKNGWALRYARWSLAA